jgi:hypothetical protein
LGSTPIIRVHMHLSEREAQELGALLHRGALPATLTWLKHRYYHVAPAVLTPGLLKHGVLVLGREPTSHQAVRLALHITESITQALTTFVRTRQAELVTAVQNPTQGLTFTFTFHSPDPAALASGRVPVPHVGVRAGHHDGPHPDASRPSAPLAPASHPAAAYAATPQAPHPAEPYTPDPGEPYAPYRGEPHTPHHGPHTPHHRSGHRYG